MAGATGAMPLTYPQLLMTPHQHTAPAAGFLPAQVRASPALINRTWSHVIGLSPTFSVHDLLIPVRFLPHGAAHSAAYAVVRCLSSTFVYFVETAKDTAVVVVQCE